MYQYHICMGFIGESFIFYGSKRKKKKKKTDLQ